jgi:hypothetical protein
MEMEGDARKNATGNVSFMELEGNARRNTTGNVRPACPLSVLASSPVFLLLFVLSKASTSCGLRHEFVQTLVGMYANS